MAKKVDLEAVKEEINELEKSIQKDLVEILWARFYRLHDKKFAPLKFFRLSRMLKKLIKVKHGL